MKVLYITNIPSPNRVDFFNMLAEKCELTVIYERKKADDRDEIWKSESNKRYKVIMLEGKHFFVDGALSFKILQYLDGKRYDIIVVGGYSMPSAMLAIQYMKMKRIPYILNSDGGYVKKDKKLVKAIKHHFITGAEAYLSTCSNGDDQLAYYGANKHKIYRYPFTGQRRAQLLEKPLSFQEKEKVKRQLGLPEKKIVLSVGRAMHLKGYDLLINAIYEKKLYDAEFYIVGGEMLEECEELISTYKLNNVHFIPFKDAETVERYYMAADIFVLPTRSDAWGLVINEALSKGLPVITTKMCNAGNELIKDGYNGYLIESEDIQGLGSSLRKILENNGTEIAQNAIDSVQEYTLESMVEKHIDIFAEVIALRCKKQKDRH